VGKCQEPRLSFYVMSTWHADMDVRSGLQDWEMAQNRVQYSVFGTSDAETSGYSNSVGYLGSSHLRAFAC
jgi:hypothetical protein